MSTRANVQSSEAIEAVRNALLSFVDQVGDSLTVLTAEMRRVQDWLEHDRPRYWRSQIHQATEAVNKAQANLHRCLMFPVASGDRPSCYEERMELKKAQAREAYCRDKAERVRHWVRNLQHEVFEYEGRISQLVRLVEIDAPQAIGVLEKILRHLEAYRALRASEPKSAYNDLEVAREIWPESPQATSENPAPDEQPTPDSEVAAAGGPPRKEP
jgi:hypothetical protein